jgi:hypothetical protein
VKRRKFANVRVLTRTQLVAELERRSRDMLGVSYTKACLMLDSGQLAGKLAEAVLTPLRDMLVASR